MCGIRAALNTHTTTLRRNYNNFRRFTPPILHTLVVLRLGYAAAGGVAVSSSRSNRHQRGESHERIPSQERESRCQSQGSEGHT